MAWMSAWLTDQMRPQGRFKYRDCGALFERPILEPDADETLMDLMARDSAPLQRWKRKPALLPQYHAMHLREAIENEWTWMEGARAQIAQRRAEADAILARQRAAQRAKREAEQAARDAAQAEANAAIDAMLAEQTDREIVAAAAARVEAKRIQRETAERLRAEHERQAERQRIEWETAERLRIERHRIEDERIWAEQRELIERLWPSGACVQSMFDGNYYWSPLAYAEHLRAVNVKLWQRR